MKLWGEGCIEDVLHEGTTVQQRLRSDKGDMTIKFSIKFKNPTRGRKVNAGSAVNAIIYSLKSKFQAVNY